MMIYKFLFGKNEEGYQKSEDDVPLVYVWYKCKHKIM
jgi:hypothetical protein